MTSTINLARKQIIDYIREAESNIIDGRLFQAGIFLGRAEMLLTLTPSLDNEKRKPDDMWRL